MLEAAKGYLKSLNYEQFLALTCDLKVLHDETIRLVYNQSLRLGFRAPNRATADVVGLTKSATIKNLRKTLTT